MSYQENKKDDINRAEYRLHKDIDKGMNNSNSDKYRNIDKNKLFFIVFIYVVCAAFIVFCSIILSGLLLCFFVLFISLLKEIMRGGWVKTVASPIIFGGGIVTALIAVLKNAKEFDKNAIPKLKKMICNLLKRMRNIFKLMRIRKKVFLVFIAITIIFTITGWFVPTIRTMAIDKVQSTVAALKQELAEKDSNKDETEDTEQKKINDNITKQLSKMRRIEKVPRFIITKEDGIISKELHEKFFNSNYQKGIIPYLNEKYLPDDNSTNDDSLDYAIINKQDLFIEKKNKAFEYESENGRTGEWYNLLPKDTELLEIIEQKEKKSDNIKSFKLYYSIANDYQELALECSNQGYTRQSEFYYLKSFENDLFSLELAQNRHDKDTAIERICYRYKDVELCCKDYLSLDEKELLKAYIWEIDEYLNK